MMKKILLFLLLAVFTLGVSAQAPSKKCPVCGLSIPKCQYKGKHPKKATTATERTTVLPSKTVKQTEIPSKAIDLGLPSGTKWAEWNIGATSPEQSGNYYAWGETTVKSDYSWTTYFDSKDGENFKTYFLYNKQKKLGKPSIVRTSRDVAFIKWGDNWQIPSADQVDELMTKCKWQWTTKKGMKGFNIIGPNGHSIFMPAAGFKHRKTVNEYGKECHYWSGDLLSTDRKESFMKYFYRNDNSYMDWTVWNYATAIQAWVLDNGKSEAFGSEIYRRRGMPVRAVQGK